MPNAIKHSALSSINSYLSAGLNSLASAGQVVGGTINNDTDRNRWMQIEIALALQGTARVVGAHIAVYLLSSIDGSVFSYGSSSVDPSPSTLLTTLAFDAVVTARTVVSLALPIPATDFQLVFENNTGQTLAASGNTMRLVFWNEEVQ